MHILLRAWDRQAPSLLALRHGADDLQKTPKFGVAAHKQSIIAMVPLSVADLLTAL